MRMVVQWHVDGTKSPNFNAIKACWGDVLSGLSLQEKIDIVETKNDESHGEIWWTVILEGGCLSDLVQFTGAAQRLFNSRFQRDLNRWIDYQTASTSHKYSVTECLNFLLYLVEQKNRSLRTAATKLKNIRHIPGLNRKELKEIKQYLESATADR